MRYRDLKGSATIYGVRLPPIYRDGNDGKQFERFVKWFLKNDPASGMLQMEQGKVRNGL